MSALEREFDELICCSNLRANLISWLPIREGDKVLEIKSQKDPITSYLREKGVCVDTVERTQWKDIEKVIHDLNEKYDYILLLQPFANSTDTLRHVFSFLSKKIEDTGEIIFVTDNVFGLKYWAGCKDPYAQDFSKGLEGYVDYNGKRGFSRNEIETVINDVGLKNKGVYYPYPDRFFPLQIFSKDRLPQKGELICNFRNYCEDRMVFFDESRVYDRLIEEGQFEFFSNVFLYRLTSTLKSQNSQEVIYSKYSNDRRKENQVRTDIVRNGGNLEVHKIPMSNDAIEHIELMFKHFQSLRNILKNSLFDINNTKRCEFGLVHEYLNGRSIEQILDYYLEQEEYDELLNYIEKYISNLKQMATQEFCLTESFLEIFGNEVKNCSAEWFGKQKSLPLTNVDLIFPNIIVENERWNMIDFEWTYEFPIPVNFVIYRAIHYYQEGKRSSQIVSKFDLYEVAGLDREECKLYRDMETNFQSYLTRGHEPLWKRYERLAGMNFFPAGALHDKKDRMQVTKVCVKYVSGQDEKVSILYPDQDFNGKYMLKIPWIEKTDYIIISFPPKHCYLNIRGIFFMGDNLEFVKPEYNGIELSEFKVVFPTDEVWIRVESHGDSYHSLYVEWDVDYLDYKELMALTVALEEG